MVFFNTMQFHIESYLHFICKCSTNDLIHCIKKLFVHEEVVRDRSALLDNHRVDPIQNLPAKLHIAHPSVTLINRKATIYRLHIFICQFDPEGEILIFIQRSHGLVFGDGKSGQLLKCLYKKKLNASQSTKELVSCYATREMLVFCAFKLFIKRKIISIRVIDRRQVTRYGVLLSSIHLIALKVRVSLPACSIIACIIFGWQWP